MCENYLISNHESDILNILEDPDKDKYFSVNINFLELFESDTNLGNALLTDPENSLKSWNEAVFNVQSNLLNKIDRKCTLKNNVNCRVYSLPPWPHVCRTIFPGNDDADKFLQVTGTVVRMSARKLLEYQRQYVCTKCKYPITVEAKYDKRNIIKQPKKCTNPEGCPGKNIITFGELDAYNCKDYQEIKIQEDLSKTGIGTVPGHMVVTLEDDLVNVCKPGENVTVTGIVKRRWSEFEKGAKIIVDIVLKANHIQVNNSSGLCMAVSDDMRQFFDSFWMKYRNTPLVGRNIILKSLSPEIYGRHLVKLAIAIVLAGGSQNTESQISTGIDTRSESHLLLVGDPGTGKSQMLRFASRLMPRSVLTTGVGSTAAGLTVTAVMENGEWQLEAGALVMADGGICCIDEFNSMREHDRTSIHEAMEQQTISVAKAGMVCKLKTRCSILAACNPKGNIDPAQPLCVNVAMSSPLLSRFDLILLLRDIVDEENDRKLADYLLNKSSELSGDGVVWSLEKLQAYYAVIKKNNPKLTTEAEMILSTYYQLQRKFGSRNKSRTTVRLLESLIRLSQGHAKLLYHSEVQVIDTIFAIILVDAALDYESSLLNLKIDDDSFFDSPEHLYWDLLENILGKLNLDYIYQRELEKIGTEHAVGIKKNSQNVYISERPDSEDSRVVSGDAPKGPQLLFSQRNPRQRRHDHNELTDKLGQNRSGGYTIDQSTSAPNRKVLLFSQRSQKMVENRQLLGNREKDESGRLLNQCNSEHSTRLSQIIGETTENITSTPRGPKLLFSQPMCTQKGSDNGNNSHKNIKEDQSNQFSDESSRVSNIGNQTTSRDIGNMSRSGQECIELLNQSGRNLQPEKKVCHPFQMGTEFVGNENNDSNGMRQDGSFSIYQNGRDSFVRKKVALNLENASTSRDKEWSKKDVNNPNDVAAGYPVKLKVGGSERKNMKLSEIVRCNTEDMDLDFDFCFTNIKIDHKGKPAEESGFCSQNTSNENSELRGSLLVDNWNRKRKSEHLTKENDANNSTRDKEKLPTKHDKSKKNCNLKNTDEMELLKLMPSVNDDFKKFDMNIDWNMGSSQDYDLEQETSDIKRSTDRKTKKDDLRNCDEEIEGDNVEVNMASKNISTKTKSSDGEQKGIDYMDKTTKDLEGKVKNTDQTAMGNRSYLDVLSKFKYVPREKKDEENSSKEKFEYSLQAKRPIGKERTTKERELTKVSEDIDKSEAKLITSAQKSLESSTKEINEKPHYNKEKYDENGQAGTSVQKHRRTEEAESSKFHHDLDNNEPDLITSSQNTPKPFKKFKFAPANKSIVSKLSSFFDNSNSENLTSTDARTESTNNSIEVGAKMEPEKGTKINSTRLSSGIDFAKLSDEIKNFDFDNNIQNPFDRKLSRFSSMSSSSQSTQPKSNYCGINKVPPSTSNVTGRRESEFDRNIQYPFNRKLSNFSSKPSVSASAELEKSYDRTDNILSVNNSREEKGCGSGPSKKEKRNVSKSNFGDLDMDFDFEDINPFKKVDSKRELFDMSQNSKNQFIRNNFSKKNNIKRMPSSSSGEL